MHIIDVQNHTDKRNIAIDRVGIRGLRHPCVIIDGDNPAQPSIGLFTLLVNLPADRKGTHMSRFIEILNEKPVTLSLKDVTNLLSTIKTRLGSTTAHLEVQMPYFMSKAAPISGVSGLMDYDITL
ncbi:MAG: GTP cyclohydrolase, FolE2/MptA family, partial [Pseudomonadota bacterium]